MIQACGSGGTAVLKGVDGSSLHVDVHVQAESGREALGDGVGADSREVACEERCVVCGIGALEYSGLRVVACVSRLLARRRRWRRRARSLGWREFRARDGGREEERGGDREEWSEPKPEGSLSVFRAAGAVCTHVNATASAPEQASQAETRIQSMKCLLPYVRTRPSGAHAVVALVADRRLTPAADSVRADALRLGDGVLSRGRERSRSRDTSRRCLRA